MIYLNRVTPVQVVMIPNSGLGHTGDAELLIRSTVENVETGRIEAYISVAGRLYHSVAVTLPDDARDGSYAYELRQDGKTLSSGCVQIGEYGGAGRQGTGGVTFRQGR